MCDRPPHPFSQVDQSGTTCMLTEYGQQAVLAQLLAELLFQMGPKCSAVELLPSLYEQYFGVPLLLPSLQVESVAQLLELPEIKAVVQVRVHCVYIVSVSVEAFNISAFANMSIHGIEFSH